MIQENDKLKSYKANNKKFPFKANEIDYLFVPHIHIDHIGLIPRLVADGFKGKIIMTRESSFISKALLKNSAYILESDAKYLSDKYKKTYEPIFKSQDVEQTYEYVYEYSDYNLIYNLDNIVSFQWLENSHCVGAAQLQLILNDTNGDRNKKKRILYTSDLGGLNNKNHYVKNTKMPTFFNDVVIMEATYGNKDKVVSTVSRKKDNLKLKNAIDSTLSNGGNVIMPCFSFARTQEILTNLYDLYSEDSSFNYSVVIDSQLSCEICDIYKKILANEDLDKWKAVLKWDNVSLVSEKTTSDLVLADNRPKIIISSSGFCLAGRILKYLQKYLSDKNSMVIFSGFIGDDESYFSYRIKNSDKFKTLSVGSIKDIPNNIKCTCLSSYSGHASRKDLIKFGGNLNTEKLILVHGSEKSKLDLAEDLKAEVSKNNKSYKVLCSTKDMVVHL